MTAKATGVSFTQNAKFPPPAAHSFTHHRACACTASMLRGSQAWFYCDNTSASHPISNLDDHYRTDETLILSVSHHVPQELTQGQGKTGNFTGEAPNWTKQFGFIKKKHNI